MHRNTDVRVIVMRIDRIEMKGVGPFEELSLEKGTGRGYNLHDLNQYAVRAVLELRGLNQARVIAVLYAQQVLVGTLLDDPALV